MKLYQKAENTERGFTLVELMVVVLIIAILLAIAIPTFLGAKNRANARAAQANLRNALTAEHTYYSSNQAFSNDVSSTGLPALQGGISWTSGTYAASSVPNQVAVAIGDNGNAVALQAVGKDNRCYTVLASNDPTNSFTAYNVGVGACSTSPSVPSGGSWPPTVNSGSAGNGTGTAYYTAW